MKIIVGLGNPGKKYEKTRHNTGFMVMDKLTEKLGVKLDMKGFKAIYTVTRVNGEKVILVEPQTYMNLSGESVLAIMNYYNADVDDLLVIHDDLDLPVGKLRLRRNGSCGGQNGMRNIINLLKTSEIKRIRVGIANDKQIDTADYVLGKVNKEDRDLYEETLIRARDAVLCYLEKDFETAMNRYNG